MIFYALVDLLYSSKISNICNLNYIRIHITSLQPRMCMCVCVYVRVCVCVSENTELQYKTKIKKFWVDIF